VEPGAVEVDHVTHRYGDRVALDSVAFSVARGEIFALLGPNGGGKTTLFRILSTSFLPTSGTARIGGIDIHEPHAVRPHIGVVFQAPGLDKRLTVVENLRHHGHLYGIVGSALRSRMDELLARFKLTDRSHEIVEKLSGGLARRVELAKGLLHRPDVLLLDEPSTGLDPGARRDLWEVLRGLEGVTILLTTHLMDEAERCGRVLILNEGKTVAVGAPDTLRAEIGGDVVTIRARDVEGLARKAGGTIVDGAVRLETERGSEAAARLSAAHGREIESITVSRPTLEDVFIRKTGHRFFVEK
jgi:ABC-2 type transport system ATP-binding protein